MRVATPRRLPYVIPNPGSSRRSDPWWGVPAVLLVALLWRIPSFFDPPWVNDEGTYFAVARAMAHGTGLYTGIWENKPPAIYLLYLGVLDLAGASIPAIRLAATIAVLGLVIVVYRIGTHYGGRESGLVAALLTALLTGVPFLEGTTANAEIFLALAAALAVYAAVCAERRFAGGVALGLAATFKAVAA